METETRYQWLRRRACSGIATAMLFTNACTAHPYTGRPQLSKTATGATLGAAGGAAVGALTGRDRAKCAAIGAGIGALAGGAVGA